jgi:predicted dehydrogenase
VVDKPFTITSADALELIELSKKVNKVIMRFPEQALCNGLSHTSKE